MGISIRKIFASDSKLHLRPIPGKLPFRGLIGVIIQSSDPDNFKTNYNSMIDTFFDSIKFEREKKVYKASEIASFIPGPPYILRGVLRTLIRNIFVWPDLEISVIFSTFDLKGLRKRLIESLPDEYREEKEEKIQAEGGLAKIIQIYGEPGSEPVEYVTVENFFETLRQYYPIVCLGSLCDIAKIKGVEFIVDGCKGPRCGYWDVLVTSDNTFSIAPHGDSYDYFISSADIITRWIDEELRQSNLPLNMSAMNRLLRQWRGVSEGLDTDHIHIAHLGNKFLGKMKPLSKRRIETFETLYLRRPIIFIILEEKSKAERRRFEYSPYLDIIHNRLSEIDGSYTFWNQDLHLRLISKTSIMVIYGDEGEAELAKLHMLSYAFEIWDLREKNSS